MWSCKICTVSELLSDVILEDLYKSKLQDSVQFQTVLALYDQETARKNGQTNYLRLKTAVKLHIDQNDGSERSCGTRISHQQSKRKESLRWEESESVFSVEGTWTMFQRRLMKFQSWHSSLWKQWRRLETKRTIVFSCILFEGKTDWRRDTKNPHSDQVNRKTRETRVKCHADSVCKNPSCKFWHPLVCLNYKSGKVVYMAITAISDMLRQRRSPTRSRRKVVQKDQLLCKRCLRESGKIEIETHR